MPGWPACRGFGHTVTPQLDRVWCRTLPTIAVLGPCNRHSRCFPDERGLSHADSLLICGNKVLEKLPSRTLGRVFMPRVRPPSRPEPCCWLAGGSRAQVTGIIIRMCDWSRRRGSIKQAQTAPKMAVYCGNQGRVSAVASIRGADATGQGCFRLTASYCIHRRCGVGDVHDDASRQRHTTTLPFGTATARVGSLQSFLEYICTLFLSLRTPMLDCALFLSAPGHPGSAHGVP